jgi:hypothetical protein
LHGRAIAQFEDPRAYDLVTGLDTRNDRNLIAA